MTTISELRQAIVRLQKRVSALGSGGSGDLLSTNNLSDVASASTSRTNLGAQATLVSGTNIKTINSTSILGSGDITISGSGLAQFEVRRMMRR